MHAGMHARSHSMPACNVTIIHRTGKTLDMSHTELRGEALPTQAHRRGTAGRRRDTSARSRACAAQGGGDNGIMEHHHGTFDGDLNIGRHDESSLSAAIAENDPAPSSWASHG